MKTKNSIVIYGVKGVGNTVKEARANAMDNIDEELNAECTPVTIVFGKFTGIAVRLPRLGWWYRIIDRDGEPGRYRFDGAGWGGSATREGTVADMVRSIAAMAHDAGEPASVIQDLFRVIVGEDREEQLQRFLKRCAEKDVFYLRHCFAKNLLRLKSNDCHDWALMNPSRRTLWEGTETMTKPEDFPSRTLMENLRAATANDDDGSIAAHYVAIGMGPSLACSRIMSDKEGA